MQSGKDYPSRVLPECAKHLFDRPFAQAHVRLEYLKNKTKNRLFCENPRFFPVSIKMVL